MKKRFTLILGSAFLLSNFINAQELFNNGSTVQINGIVVFVNGGIENNTAGTIVNDGNFWSTNNGVAPGSLTLNGASSTSGTGKFYVEQDFVNNANWNGAGNEVIMTSNSANQNILGTSATSFSHLTLDPSPVTYPDPKVIMGINVTVTDSLWLNNRELATQGNILTITSATNGAITNNPTQGSEGFISSVAPGYTEWQTATNSTYFFPVGSSAGTLRYRPIDITPATTVPNTFTVRFNNNDASVDGFNRLTTDSTFCNSNPNWYHSITKVNAGGTADVKVYYDPTADGNSWDGLAQWQTSVWNNMLPTAAGTSGYFSTQTKAGWAFTDPSHPYILTESKPLPPSINCPPPICSNNPNVMVTASGSATGNYVWTLPDNSTVNGSDTLSVNFTWPTGSPVTVVSANSTNTCFSNPVTCNVSVVQSPDAGFTSTEDQNNELMWSFTDTTTGSVSSSIWTIDGTNYTGNPTVTFGGPGTYNVTLISTNGTCADTAYGTIVVDWTEVLSIPNVFSPNGDGINDEFFITHSGFKEFKLTIFNRWGQVMYSADAPSFHWDGKDLDGDIVSDGTYYFFITATNLAGKPVEKDGYLMVYKK